jgi:hypothetical protein
MGMPALCRPVAHYETHVDEKDLQRHHCSGFIVGFTHRDGLRRSLDPASFREGVESIAGDPRPW